jgi:drug/metabolite transporter (DMT)-like permease
MFHPAVLISLGSVTAYSFYLLLTRKLAGVVPGDTLQLYTGAVGTAMFLPVLPFIWVSPDGIWPWLIMLAIGIWGYIGHEFLTRAYELGEASMLAPFAYSFLIYMTLWSAFLFDQPPDFWGIVGTIIVAIAGLIIWARERLKGPDQ